MTLQYCHQPKNGLWWLSRRQSSLRSADEQSNPKTGIDRGGSIVKGTEAIVEILAYEDIPFAVVYPGSGIENVIVALARDEKKRIRCILPRHERVGMDILDILAPLRCPARGDWDSIPGR
jgi:hypothetical protein